MIEQIDNGGPAFAAPGMPAYSPEGLPLNPWAGHGWAHDPQPGMTLRDYFAAAAMQGLCNAFAAQSGNTWPDDRTPEDYDVAAKHSYGLADAMLAARKEKP